MKLAKSCGIDVPPHGLVYAKDHSMLYFINGTFGSLDEHVPWRLPAACATMPYPVPE